MEKITDSFRVAAPIDTTWHTLLDIERIAPSLPGAQLQEIEGDEYRGIVKVKVGPITAQYKGAAKLAKVDEGARTIVIDASGRDTRGQGNASATITVVMREDRGGTHVDIDTDLHVTGKVAQFGRGVMSEVSAKLLKQFVNNLEHDVLGVADPHAQVEEPEEPAAPVPAAPHTHASGNGAAASQPSGGARKIDSPEAEPVDLMDAAGASLVKRVVPLLIGMLVTFVVVRQIRKLRRRGR